MTTTYYSRAAQSAIHVFEEAYQYWEDGEYRIATHELMMAFPQLPMQKVFELMDGKHMYTVYSDKLIIH
jgi:hypothetical protein